MAGDISVNMKSIKSNINVDNYRKLVQTYISLHVYDAALFWADKVVALTGNDPKDVYWLAQCMFLQQQYHRAVYLLKRKNLDTTYILCNILVVRCLLAANELNEALKVLNSMNIDLILQSDVTTYQSTIESAVFDDTPKQQLQSSVLLVKGKVLEAMDNRGLASECYRQALICDVHCYEAFEALIKHNMLTAREEIELLNSLPILQQCTKEEAEILLLLYKSKLKKYHEPSTGVPHLLLEKEEGTLQNNSFIKQNLPNTKSNPNFNTPQVNIDKPVSISTPNIFAIENKESLKRKGDSKEKEGILLKQLHNSLDLKVAEAEKLYYDCHYVQCCMLTEKILKEDPYHSSCLPIHISCQVELKQSNKLFTLAHKLVDLYPNMAISWFSVGCYYYVINKSDSARRYLAKSASLDRLFGPAWLAYGHSFAMENEHDQAMAAYFKASQLMKGCHLPLLYIGLECGLTNNIKLAEKFFQQAIAIAPNDPFVLHEMGVVAFQNLDYVMAEKYFKKAFNIVKSSKNSVLPQIRAPLLNNLGHTARKLKNYESALEYHSEALRLCPQSANTYSAIAFVHTLMGNLEEAVCNFHKALGFKRDDTFSTTMLNYVIEQLSEDEPPYEDAPEEIPDFKPKFKSEDNTPQDLQEEDFAYTSTNNTNMVDMSMSMEVNMSDVSGVAKES